MNRFHFLLNLAALIPGVKFTTDHRKTSVNNNPVKFSEHTEKAYSASFRKNPMLETVKKGWTGNPINPDGTFENHEFPFNPEFSQLWKWQTTKNPDSEKKKKEKFSLPVQPAKGFFEDKRDGICWMGHASFFIRLNGKLMVIDPVLGAPFSMNRHTPLPFDKNDFPQIDYLLLSHDHRDHMDEESLRFIGKKNLYPTVFTGLEMATTIFEWIPGANIYEAGWYQKFPAGDEMEIIFLPSRHWSRRGLFDTKKRLWGAFLIRKPGFSIYFGGDSGFGSHFKEVADLFGPPDIAILGIGAYKPEWFMSSSHTSPKDALCAASDMQAKTMIPMHYGVFDLADECMSDPLETLIIDQRTNFSHVFMKIPLPGEAVFF